MRQPGLCIPAASLSAYAAVFAVLFQHRIDPVFYILQRRFDILTGIIECLQFFIHRRIDGHGIAKLICRLVFRVLEYVQQVLPAFRIYLPIKPEFQVVRFIHGRSGGHPQTRLINRDSKIYRTHVRSQKERLFRMFRLFVNGFHICRNDHGICIILPKGREQAHAEINV